MPESARVHLARYVVVVRRRRSPCPACVERRDDHRADAAAARARDARQRRVRPGPSPQHADASASGAPNSASSKVITSMPSAERGRREDLRHPRRGGTRRRVTSPPGRPSTHGSSWPSLQRFGVMNERFGVARRVAEVGGEPVEPTTCSRARGRVDDRVEVHERVVTVAYWSPGLGLLRVVRRVDRRMAARLRLGRRVADVLHVALPRQALGLELVGDGAARSSG